jgi:hypothetical protein
MSDKLINCLSYALRFWNENPRWIIWFNGDHAINSDHSIKSDPKEKMPFKPLDCWSIKDIERMFGPLITESDMKLLHDYYGL